MMMKETVLIVDDDEQLTDILSILLESEGYEVASAGTAAAGWDAFQRVSPSLVLLDLRLGEDSGLDLLPRLRERDPHVPIFMITAHGDVDSAVDAFKQGVTGYVKKPFQEGELKLQIAQAVETYRLRSEVRKVMETAPGQEGNDPRSIIRTKDPVMEPLLKRVAMAAQVTSNAVIHGESGTGKELVARALHRCGPRRSGPFIAFNCAALPEALLESELFGYARGAFTDARENKPGLFARAHGGTLFLDEIGDAPLSIQTKLLRVLQEREVLPLGATTPIKIDVRVVAATHRSLKEEVDAGRFRADLYYRLHVLPLSVPPLRERPRDVLYLAALFASRLGDQMQAPFEGFTAGAEKALERHAWPGNVRELQNRIEHALALTRGGLLTAASLFPELEGASELEAAARKQAEERLQAETSKSEEAGSAPAPFMSYKDAKVNFEKSYLMKVLHAARGNIAQAARIADKSRAEVYSLLRKHGLNPGSFKP